METSSRHTTEVYQPSQQPVSITENTSVQEFLANAEAAQRSFQAERQAYNIVGNEGQLQDVSEDSDEWGSERDSEDGEEGEEEEEDEGPFCSIPKKPEWRAQGEGGLTPEEFQLKENLTFLKWKRRLARIQAKQPQLPPFEKNLDFWRQFWKIIELSDVVVQVVDARNPLFFYSQDVADYVKEVAEWKANVLLLNKADYLTREQRETWAQYFQDSDLKAIFFSAVEAQEDKERKGGKAEEDPGLEFNTSRIMNPHEVLETVQSLSAATPLTVGFLGYPNVGKSSTINCFLNNKRLQVSATPGKTKHYQTHVLKGEVVLVDGPGLVIPDLSMTKASMVLNGVLPIDNLTDWNPSMDLLLTQIPFAYIQKHYGIMASCVKEARRADRKSQGNQILSAFGIMRGFMKPGGVPDQSRAARVILKDYITGRIVFCHAPPGVEQAKFCAFEVDDHGDDYDLELGESFPELRVSEGAHLRGVNRNHKGGAEVGQLPGKAVRKAANRKKREKARRVYKEQNPYMM